MALVDLDGDGFLDIVTADFTDNTVSVLMNKGNGTFKPRTTVLVGNGKGSFSPIRGTDTIHVGLNSTSCGVNLLFINSHLVPD